MGDKTKIEWTDASWTPIRARYWEIQNDGSGKERVGWHCEHVSEGCRNCYAEGMNLRLGTGLDFKPGNLYREEKVGYSNGDVKLFLDEKLLIQPLHWKRPRRIFVCSMTDLFASFVPDEMIDRMFAVMALCPQHTFQILTKRPERMRQYIGAMIGGQRSIAKAARELPWKNEIEAHQKGDSVLSAISKPLPNVWLGTSVEDQPSAEARIPHLLTTPAAIRFLSCEPLLGHVHLGYICWPGGPSRARDGYNALIGARYENGAVVERLPKLDWVICGGESGRSARPMRPDWARSLRDQCGAAAIAFHFKQWGEWSITAPPGVRSEPMQGRTSEDFPMMFRVGKATAGRKLDGVEHNAFPAVAA